MAIVRLLNTAGTPLPRMVAALKGNWIGVDSKGSEVRTEAVSKAEFSKGVWQGDFSQPEPKEGVTISYLELEADFSDNTFYQDTRLKVKVKKECEKVKGKDGKVTEICRYITPSDISIFATNITRDAAQMNVRREQINSDIVAAAIKKVKESK